MHMITHPGQAYKYVRVKPTLTRQKVTQMTWIIRITRPGCNTGTYMCSRIIDYLHRKEGQEIPYIIVG